MVDSRPRPPTVLAGLAGCALLALSPGTTAFAATTYPSTTFPGWWKPLLAVVLATAVGLSTLRYWPHLLAAGALLTLPRLVFQLEVWDGSTWLLYVERAAAVLLLIGLLAAVQSLVRGGAAGWGAALGGAAFGAQVVAVSLAGAAWITLAPEGRAGRVIVTLLGLAGLVPALRAYRRGDPDAGPTVPRLIVVGTLAACTGVIPYLVTPDRVARILDVELSTLGRHPLVMIAAVGLAVLVAGLVLGAVAGPWSLAGGLTAAVAQAALAVPLLLAVYALAREHPLRLVMALLGVALGGAVAAGRWRVPVAAALAVVAATVLFILFAATSGEPEKLITQQSTAAGTLLLVLFAATATALVGTTAPLLARRNAAPAVLGPIVAALVLGGQQVLRVTYVGPDGQPESSQLNSVNHITTSALLMLVAAAGVGGLAAAELFAARRAERRMTEAVRREAAEAERNRLARPIHDGVLQVLALVQRHGPEMGERGEELAKLAGNQEAALRTLITSDAPGPLSGRTDLRSLLTGLAAPGAEFVTPAGPVELPARTAAELRDAVAAALDNVRRHAGPDARAWVLVENEPDGVRVTVRDDGMGIASGRLDEAAAAGRLGVAQSMRGRIGDLGGTTSITSRPGEGTEVEFWLPVAP